MTVEPKLASRNLGLTFVTARDTVEVLRDINIAVAEGEFVAIVGPSGCGKTTLLRIVGGLVHPTVGEALIDGRRIVAPGNERGFVFQQDALFPWRTILSNVTFGLELQGKPRAESREHAEQLIEMVGLRGFAQHHPHELSGGMRQRANLARALAIDPELLLMDEPFASLDAQTREIMQRELLRIWSVSRKTVLFITHQIDEAIYLADRVLVMTSRPGRFLADITIDFPRPRELAVKRDPSFVALVDRVWQMLEQEVVASASA